MKLVFGRLENKFVLEKLRAFLMIKRVSQLRLVKRVKIIVQAKLERLATLMETKLFNHKITALYAILDHSTRRKKIQKYQ